MHPFEAAGLGTAPFKFVGVEEKRGPLVWTDSTGVTHTAGSPGQPMGACEYCGEGIVQCCNIRSADGKQFVVGSTCVGKTGDKPLVRQIGKEMRRQTKEREASRIADIEKRLEDDTELRTKLASTSSPNSKRPQDSALDWSAWMLKYAGHTGKMQVVRYVERRLS